MSPKLKAFYKAMQAWIDDGAPSCNKIGFFKEYGLCTNLEIYIDSTNGHDYSQCRRVLSGQMILQFEEAFLNSKHPFNESIMDYSDEGNNQTIFQNPKRLAWIKQHSED